MALDLAKHVDCAWSALGPLAYGLSWREPFTRCGAIVNGVFRLPLICAVTMFAGLWFYTLVCFPSARITTALSFSHRLFDFVAVSFVVSRSCCYAPVSKFVRNARCIIATESICLRSLYIAALALRDGLCPTTAVSRPGLLVIDSLVHCNSPWRDRLQR